MPNEQLENAREAAGTYLDANNGCDCPICETFRILLAATAPVPGDLGEAMEKCEEHSSDLDQWGTENPDLDDDARLVAKEDAAAIRKVCQAVRQGKQPEVDPELVAGWRKVETETLREELASGKDVLNRVIPGKVAFWEQRNAAIRQVLTERGETDGRAV